MAFITFEDTGRRKLATKNKAFCIKQHNAAPLDVVNPVCEPPKEEEQQELDRVATRLNLVRQYSEQAYARYLGHDTRPENLLRVVQINLHNALAGNSLMLGLSTAWLYCHSVSPFGLCGPSPNQDAISALPASYPENLRPTALQASITHHPWIDLLPWPQLRDTILASIENEIIDEDELCYDIVEFDTSANPAEKAALIVWGEPWDPQGWEASTTFLRKWGWTLKGCPELLKATNYWREKRGERKLALPPTEMQWNITTHGAEGELLKSQRVIERVTEEA